jgi:hypothetical protein
MLLLLGELMWYRLEETWSLYLQGIKPPEIARRLGPTITDEKLVRIDLINLRRALRDPRARQYREKLITFAGIENDPKLVKRLEHLINFKQAEKKRKNGAASVSQLLCVEALACRR